MGRDVAMSDDGPRYLWLDDGRLLTWFFTAPDRVSVFQCTVDEWIGVQPIDRDEGLAMLTEQRRQRDGRLLGPLAELPIRALGRRSR